MAELTRIFSASVACLSQVDMMTCEGAMPESAAFSDAGSRRSAATGVTFVCGCGLRARPQTCQLSLFRTSAVALPTIPLAPTINAFFVMYAPVLV